MNVWTACLLFHAWQWNHALRLGPRTRRARVGTPTQERHRGARGPEEREAALWNLLPPGLAAGRRLGLDLGIDPDLALGGRRDL